MSFHFVDRIYEYEPFKRIRGLKNVTRNEGFFYWLPDGRRVLSPAVVTEAMAQLGGWLKMVSTDFKQRAVLLGDERTDYVQLVEAGQQIDLHVEVVDISDDVVVTKGYASVDGQVVLRGDCCRGFLLDAKEFDDPETLRRQFNNLYRPQFKDSPRVKMDPSMRQKAIAGHRTFDALRFVDGIIEHKPYERVVGFKNFSSCEPYFATHFPRKPCVPGVLLLTFMGEVSQYLVKDNLDAPIRGRALVPTFIQNVRFRKFVEPGDQCTLEAKVISGDCRKNGEDVLVRTIISANGTKVMQAEMGFKVMLAAAKPTSVKTPLAG